VGLVVMHLDTKVRSDGRAAGVVNFNSVIQIWSVTHVEALIATAEDVDEESGFVHGNPRREEPFDSLRSLRTFDSLLCRLRVYAKWVVAVNRMACHERAQRVEWRRGELNPRPETTQMAASTCLVDVLISTATTNIDILRHGPAVFISFAANDRACEPARFYSRRFTGVNVVPRLPVLGSHCERGTEADATRDITVIGSWCLLTWFSRPSERPAHATTTVAIRSKPIAPSGLSFERALLVVRPDSISV